MTAPSKPQTRAVAGVGHEARRRGSGRVRSGPPCRRRCRGACRARRRGRRRAPGWSRRNGSASRPGPADRRCWRRSSVSAVAAGVEGDVAGGGKEFAGDHGRLRRAVRHSRARRGGAGRRGRGGRRWRRPRARPGTAPRGDRRRRGRGGRRRRRQGEARARPGRGQDGACAWGRPVWVRSRHAGRRAARWEGRRRVSRAGSGRLNEAPQRIGAWTVTSLVPSGKVASTWTSWIISGTPSMHCVAR